MAWGKSFENVQWTEADSAVEIRSGFEEYAQKRAHSKMGTTT